MQHAATFGFAPLLSGARKNQQLVEFPFGAHSVVLLALDDDYDGDSRFRLIGVATNGTGARFHVREASNGGGREVVTLDYVRPLTEGRSFAEMPTQAVYYRLDRDGFQEVGRGEVFDPVEAPWDVPRAIEPFLDPAWLLEHRP